MHGPRGPDGAGDSARLSFQTSPDLGKCVQTFPDLGPCVQTCPDYKDADDNSQSSLALRTPVSTSRAPLLHTSLMPRLDCIAQSSQPHLQYTNPTDNDRSSNLKSTSAYTHSISFISASQLLLPHAR
jgi:hypothetical protein